MLESGSNFFACEIINSLSENNVYQSYLARSEDGTSVRLLVSVAFFVESDQRVLDLAQKWTSFDSAGATVPLRTGVCDGRFVCTYPAFEGQTLDDYSLDHQLSNRYALEVLQSLVRLLVEAHNADLVHGNISPATIVFKGADLSLDCFCLTQMFKLDYQSGLNPAYTSPEQVRGEALVVASDIYSLGCVLYSLLSGQQPFNGVDSFTVAMQHLQGVFPELPEGHCCRQLLADMTGSGIDERLTAAQLLDEIQQLLDSEEIDQAQPLGVDVNQHPIKDDYHDSDTLQALSDDNLDFTARIEARLKEYSSVMTESGKANDGAGDENEVTDALEQFPTEKNSQIWRYLLILIIGILVGSGTYFMVIHDSVDSLPAQELSVDDFFDRLDQALVAWQEADVDNAIIRLQELVKQYPDDPRPINNLAAIYAAQGDYEQAREYLELALKTDVNYATIYNNLASIYAEMARDSYGKALLLDQTRGPLQLVALSSQGGVEVGTSPQHATTSLPAISEPDDTAIPINDTENIKPQADVAVVVEAVAENVQEETDIAAIETSAVGINEPDSTEVVDLLSESTAIEPEAIELAAVVSTPVGEDSEQFMQRWAKAWTDQDVVAYLACYDDEFSPPGGKTRMAWESQRQQRISKPNSINVALVDLQVENQDDGSVRFEAIQVYNSDVYSDKTHKVFNLHQINGTWSILRERSLGSAQ